MKGVVRIDIPATKKRGATHGWQARVTWRGEQFTKFFSDGQIGYQQARKHAVAAVNDLETELGKPHTQRKIHGQPTCRSRAGVLGVHRIQNRKAYLASFCPQPGVLKRRYFSIIKLGKWGALQAALKWRRAQEIKIYGGG